MDPILLQKQVKDNAEELQDYLSDLNNWEKEMKRKDAELRAEDPVTMEQLPAVRSKMKKEERLKKMKKLEEKAPRISSDDYEAWGKFDVEKACDELDKEEVESSDTDEEQLVAERLKQQALVEKNRGNDYFKLGIWDEAIKCYTTGIHCDPLNATLVANRGMAHLKKGQFAEAEIDCNAAIDLDPTYIKAYHRRASVRLGLGRLAEAREDYLKVLELEPHNKVAKTELEKIEKKISKEAQGEEKKDSVKEVPIQGGRGDGKEVKKVTFQSNEEGESRKVRKGEKMKEKPEQSSALPQEESDVSQAAEGLPSSIVTPIYKPPHLQSKKPLQRMKIQEIGDELECSTTEQGSTDFKSSLKLEDKSTKESDTTSEEQESTCNDSGLENVTTDKLVCSDNSPEGRSTVSSSNVDSDEVVPSASSLDTASTLMIPPPPLNSVQFYLEWKKMKGKLNIQYQYLKQIPGLDYPKIFRDSLESETFSSILRVLKDKFVPAGDSVLPHLQGLCHVKRFGALIMFMSSADKKDLEILIKHCEDRGECSSEEAAVLRKKYEL